MTHHDAWVIKNMRNQGATIADIAYVLDCSERTVRRCIDRDYRPTEKKCQIADRQEKFFPTIGDGNYKAGIVKLPDETETSSVELSSNSNPTEASAIAEEEIKSRLRSAIDRLSLERLIQFLNMV